MRERGKGEQLRGEARARESFTERRGNGKKKPSSESDGGGG